jgi:hypothetical protein
MTNTSSPIKISINSILVWLSIIIILSLLVYLLISQVKTNPRSDVPVGTIIASACTTAPDGYLNCDGSEVDKNKYPKLYKVVTVLPNLKRKFLRGCDSEDNVLKEVNESTTAKNGLSIDDHHHSFKSYKDGGTGQPGSGDFVASQAGNYSTDRGINYVYLSTDATKESPVQDESLTISGDDETAPEHVFVFFFMKAE